MLKPLLVVVFRGHGPPEGDGVPGVVVEAADVPDVLGRPGHGAAAEVRGSREEREGLEVTVECAVRNAAAPGDSAAAAGDALEVQCAFLPHPSLAEEAVRDLQLGLPGGAPKAKGHPRRRRTRPPPPRKWPAHVQFALALPRRPGGHEFARVSVSTRDVHLENLDSSDEEEVVEVDFSSDRDSFLSESD